MSSNNNMTHWSHPEHALEMIDEGSRFLCDGCKMDGIGKRYTCKQRDFCLHPCCMFTKHKITIEGRTYYFLDNPKPVTKCKGKKAGCTKCGRSCDACGKTVLGFFYHCPDNDWDFHPACFQLLDSEVNSPDASFLLKRKEVASKCALCKKKIPEGAEKEIPGWSYVVEDKDMNFHVYCMMELAIETHSSSKIKNDLLSTEETEVLHKTKSKKNSEKEMVMKFESCSSQSNKDLLPALKGTEVLPKRKSKRISTADVVKESDSFPSKSNIDLSMPLEGTDQVLPETKSKKPLKVMKLESCSSKSNKDIAPEGTEVLWKSNSKRISKAKLVKESDSYPSKSNEDLLLPLKGTDQVLPETKSKKISKTKSVVKHESCSSKSNKDLSPALKGTEVVQKSKAKRISKTKPKKTSKTKEWLMNILQVFISTTVSIFLGDPTTIFVSTMVQIIFEALFNVSG